MNMRYDLTDNGLAELIHSHKPGWSLQQPFYTDPLIFELDIEKVWMKYWLYAGHLSQLSGPGSYFTYQLGNEPAIILKDEHDQLRALMNVCRHRGSLICTEPQGKMKKLVCPYHQWVYDLDGALRAANLMPEDFDRSGFGLHEIHCRELEGFIFISFAENPPDFDKLEQIFLPHLKIYDLRRTRIAYTQRDLVNSNWKLVTENFRECYHCGGNHPELCSIIIGFNLHQGQERAQLYKEQKLRQWEQQGIPTYPIWFEPGNWYHCVRYPYDHGNVTSSLDGKPVAPPLFGLKHRDVGLFTIVLYPGFWMDVNNDYIWTMYLRPVSATQTETVMNWLVREDAQEGKDYDLQHLLGFWQVTAGQDWRLCENNQAGINSRFYRPGPYSDYAEAGPEGGPSQFVDWYLDQLAD